MEKLKGELKGRNFFKLVCKGTDFIFHCKEKTLIHAVSNMFVGFMYQFYRIEVIFMSNSLSIQ